MKYDVVHQSLEEFVKTQWAAGPDTVIQYENVPFNSDAYTEYLRCSIVFGEGFAKTVTQGCYRQVGVLLLSILTKPGIGEVRKLQLATLAADMIKHQRVSAVLPLVAPVVNLKVPDLHNDPKERNGWVMAQVSCPFYYDFSS
jgi:hypothetical protein